MYEERFGPVQKISTRYKSTFFRLHDARGTRKTQFLPTKRTFWISKREGRGWEEERYWYDGEGVTEQGVYGLVGHVPHNRMVRFGGYPTQVEGAGGDTVKIFHNDTLSFYTFKTFWISRPDHSTPVGVTFSSSVVFIDVCWRMMTSPFEGIPSNKNRTRIFFVSYDVRIFSKTYVRRIDVWSLQPP